MKKSLPFMLVLGLLAIIAQISSCTANLDIGEVNMNSGGSAGVCIYLDYELCLPAFDGKNCPGGGTPGPKCPENYIDDSQGSSGGNVSSSSLTPSSSSVIPSSSSKANECISTVGNGSFKDERDQKTYNYVTICNQTWMAENLNYAVDGSECYDNNLESNCDIYGRFYDWATAMGLADTYNSTRYSATSPLKHKGICPTGWHMPNKDEWEELETAVGSSTTASKYLRATSGWDGNGNNGEDKYGFAALPGGYGGSDGYFYSTGSQAWFLSATEDNAIYALLSRLYATSMDKTGYYKHNLYSVRCVKD